MSDKQVLINMLKKSLDDIIDVPLAEGYTLRSYKEGDKDMWIALYDRLDEYYHVTPDDFDESYGDNHEEIEVCVLFVQGRQRNRHYRKLARAGYERAKNGSCALAWCGGRSQRQAPWRRDAELCAENDEGTRLHAKHPWHNE